MWCSPVTGRRQGSSAGHQRVIKGSSVVIKGSSRGHQWSSRGHQGVLSGNQCATPAVRDRVGAEMSSMEIRCTQWQSVLITCPGGPEISPKRIACRGRCDGRATAAAAAAAASDPPSDPPSPPPSTSSHRGGTGQRQTLLKERRHRHSSSDPPPATKRAWRCGEHLHAKGAQAQALELRPSTCPARQLPELGIAQYGASSDAIKAIKAIKA